MAKKKRKNKRLQQLLAALLQPQAATPGPDWSQYEALQPSNPASILAMLGGGSSYQNEFALGGGMGGGGGGAPSSGSDAIMGAARQAASYLEGIAPAIGGYYNTAQGRETAAMQGLYQQLNNSGSAIGSNIAMQLGQAGQNIQPGIDVGNIGGQSAATVGALGSANLSALIGQGAAAQSYAATLPGVAMQQGAADAALAAMGAQEANRDRAAAMAEAQMQYEAQSREAMASALMQSQELEYQKALTRLQFKGDLDAQLAEGRAADKDRIAALVKAVMDQQAAAADASREHKWDVQNREDEQAHDFSLENFRSMWDEKLKKLGLTKPNKARDLTDLYDLATTLFTEGAIVPARVDPDTGNEIPERRKKLAPANARRRLTLRAKAMFPRASAAEIRKIVNRAMRYGGYADLGLPGGPGLR